MKRLLLTVPNFKCLVERAMILGRSFCFKTYRKVKGSLSRNLQKKGIKNTLQLLKRQYEKPMNELPSRIGTANVFTNVHTERKALNIIVGQSLI